MSVVRTSGNAPRRSRYTQRNASVVAPKCSVMYATPSSAGR